jgi:hypothetical protein
MRDHPDSVTILTSVPPTPAEAAARAVAWERRGLLGRLILSRPLRAAAETR